MTQPAGRAPSAGNGPSRRHESHRTHQRTRSITARPSTTHRTPSPEPTPSASAPSPQPTSRAQPEAPKAAETGSSDPSYEAEPSTYRITLYPHTATPSSACGITNRDAQPAPPTPQPHRTPRAGQMGACSPSPSRQRPCKRQLPTKSTNAGETTLNDAVTGRKP